VSIEPDTKDWTWVLGRPCPECGYDAASVDAADVAARVRQVAAAFAGVLTAPGAARRPSASAWSPLEYGCHVRDVLRVYDERLHLMLTQDDPLYANWDQDATAVADRYGEQDPAEVARELTGAAEVIAGHFGQLAPEDWARPGRRSDGASFTVDSFARYFLHDLVHHLHDVRA
jgi:hypothetical protein